MEFLRIYQLDPLEKIFLMHRGRGLISRLNFLTGFILMVFFLISCSTPANQKAMEILQEGIADESVIIRVSAAKGLAQTGDEQGMRVLHAILGGDDEDGIVASLRALSDLQEQIPLPTIVKLAKSNNASIRTEAYYLIALVDNETCQDILIEGTIDSIAKIRRISYRGLEKFKQREVIHNGLRDIDPLVRIAAAKVLGNLGEEDIEGFILKEMETTDIEVLKHGITALAEMGDTSVIPLIKGFITGTPWELRIAAAEALLIFNNNKDGISIVKQGLTSHDPFTRLEAVGVIKRYNIPDVLELLQETLKDEYVNISVAAIEALVNYNAKASRRLFEEMMDAPNPVVKIAAAAAYLQSE